MKRLSIGERLRKAHSLDVRRKIALDWTANWIADHDETIRDLECRLARGDIAGAGQSLAQIKGLSDKRFAALPNLIEKLTDEDIA